MGCQLLAVVEGQGGVLVASYVLGTDIRARKGLANGDRVLWVLQDAPIAFDVPGRLLVLLAVCMMLLLPLCSCTMLNSPSGLSWTGLLMRRSLAMGVLHLRLRVGIVGALCTGCGGKHGGSVGSATAQWCAEYRCFWAVDRAC